MPDCQWILNLSSFNQVVENWVAKNWRQAEVLKIVVETLYTNHYLIFDNPGHIYFSLDCCYSTLTNYNYARFKTVLTTIIVKDTNKLAIRASECEWHTKTRRLIHFWPQNAAKAKSNTVRSRKIVIKKTPQAQEGKTKRKTRRKANCAVWSKIKIRGAPCSV